MSPSKWIRIDRPFPLPSYVKEAIQTLNEAGHIAYIVGGSVRDFLLGRQIKDHDIATSADPDELCELFPKAITVGKAYGVLKVPVEKTKTLLEIATFREDMEYQDFRRPKGVRFAGPEEDASRRDFTVNALFYDPKTSRILDSTGGMDDLKVKVIRAIGDPLERFREDALRLLRAVRFTTTLGFELEAKTAEAIQTRAKLIGKVSGERVRDELSLMWMGPRPAEAFVMLDQLGLLNPILPELDAVRRNLEAWTHARKVVEILAKQNSSRGLALAWAGILIDIRGMDVPKLIRSITDRLRLPKDESNLIVTMIEEQIKFKESFQMREATLQRFIREPHFEEMLALHRADATATDGNLAYYEFCESKLKALKASDQRESPKLIDGDDLIQLGLSPGPGFSEILRTVEDLAMEKKLGSKEEALEYVVKHFVR